ncbi:MAG: S24/S26 family peptidase [Erythrobacter sp.]
MSLFGFTFARIDGGSMEPVLPSGSMALFRRRKTVVKGDIVLADHPEFGVIVKRVRAIEPDGALALEGTAPQSTSAQRLGSVEPARVRGVLLKHW